MENLEKAFWSLALIAAVMLMGFIYFSVSDQIEIAAWLLSISGVLVIIALVCIFLHSAREMC